MRALSFVLYFLPLSFYTLGMAPNYTENSILHMILSISIVFSGALGFFEQLIRKKLFRPTLPLVGGITLLALFAYLNLHQYELIVAGVATVLLMFGGLKLGRYYTYIIAGVGLFLVSYLTITGFGFSQLTKVKFLVIALPSAVFFAAFFRKSNWKWSPLILLIAMSIVFLYLDQVKYLVVFSIVLIPTILFLRAGWGKKVWVEAFTIVSLAGFFVYYVLYATYLIQALQGGF